MNKRALIRAINQLADEALNLSSNRAARELSAKIEGFEKEHHCEALMEKIFIETGAGETLADMLINFDDNMVSTEPKF